MQIRVVAEALLADETRGVGRRLLVVFGALRDQDVPPAGRASERLWHMKQGHDGTETDVYDIDSLIHAVCRYVVDESQLCSDAGSHRIACSRLWVVIQYKRN